MQLNTNFNNLQQSYLFVEIARRVEAFKTANPNADVIRLGIGDITRPLVPSVVAALTAASAEVGNPTGVKGYNYESSGYPFLTEAIAGYYGSLGAKIAASEVYVNDGAKTGLGNILNIFGQNRVLVPDPVYPAYVDTNIMNGNEILYVNGTEDNGFLPAPPEFASDIIYICSPNNPTGGVYNKQQLKAWVDYANANDALILFDSAYMEFISEPGLPRSIFEIEGARTCALEFGTFSKMAGFTGTRCGWIIIPSELERNGVNIAKLWNRHQGSMYNGVSYVIQRGAEAALSASGLAENRANIAYYMDNAKIITAALDKAGIVYTGGRNSPYVWLKCGRPSWDFFDYLLSEKHVVGTPGAGFGVNGEGWFRLTAFGTHENTLKAADRIAG